ncbi:MAG: MFS transporter [Deltaproteobacteria bacterium]|nr:MFS transporter [Deltaproteobacteria bacterium]
MDDKASRSMSDSWLVRWGVLLLISLSMAVNYYFYDALSPLKEVLTVHLGFDSSDYGFFVSVYSIPNVLLAMAVVGGIILDRIGIRITGSLFISSMVLGSFLTWYGASDTFNAGGPAYALLGSFWTDYSPALKMMCVGYFLFGLGAETTCVVISKVVVKWFKGRELALALGINISVARLGTAAALIISPRLLEPVWTRPIFLGFVLLAIGLVAFLFYCLIDKAYDRRARTIRAGGEEEPEEQFRIRDVLRLLRNPSFIFVAALCVTFYSAVFPFIKYAPDLLVNKFGLDEETSGFITSILPFGTLVFTPVFGWVCDYKGKSASLMVLGSVLLIAVHLLLSLTTISPYVPMFILGVAFSLVPAAMWPSVAKIVDESRLGSAYGLMFSIQNIGLWIFPMLIGVVLDAANPGVAAMKTAVGMMAEEGGYLGFAAGPLGDLAVYDYTWPVLMLAALGALGLLFAFLLRRADKTSGYGLEQPNRAAPSADEPGAAAV